MTAQASGRNRTEEFTIVAGQDQNRTPIFSVLVKRTFDLGAGGAVSRAAQVRPLIQVDEYYDDGDPQVNSLRFETDLMPYKAMTDFVVIGKAYAPGGRPVTGFDVLVEVATYRKRLRVTGDRCCVYQRSRRPSFTEPKEFAEMELRYELAYGGTDRVSIPALPFSYPRNPVGKGLALRNLRKVIDGLALPNIEDPEDLLTPERIVIGDPDGWSQQPLPQGLGWFHRAWYPRCSFAGAVPGFVTPETVLKEETLGLVPTGQIALARQFRLPSFDVRFNNGASPGLALPSLKGGELVRLHYLTAEGKLEFTLPQDSPRISLNLGLGDKELEVVLQTVCVRVEDRQLDLVWRGAHPYPGVDWLPEMKQMIATID